MKMGYLVDTMNYNATNHNAMQIKPSVISLFLFGSSLDYQAEQKKGIGVCRSNCRI